MGNVTAHSRTLRLGTRGSQLARWQAEWVAGELRKLGHAIDLVEIATQGDIQRTAPIEEIGTRGVFTKAIQEALLSGEIDLAVHSLKDLPTEPVDGLILAAVPPRESAADVLVERRRVAGVESVADEPPGLIALGARLRLDPSHPTPGHPVLASLREGARVGTGSLRRQAQLRYLRPDLQVEEVRGNVDTRLRKLDEGQFEAIVLAQAGLRRLGLAERISWVLPFEVMLPAVGQGALGIECRADDDKTLAAVRLLEDAATRAAVTAERSLLAQLRGGCMAPVGALARVEGDQLKLQSAVLSVDGTKRVEAAGTTSLDQAELLGEQVAQWLIEQGAAELIAESRTGDRQ
jgi:hydroxymethylbilane synthase